MADSLHKLISEARKNKFSLIPSLSEDDIVNIWRSASDFIERQMLQRKGVSIQGLGTFTFSQKKLDVGSNKIIVIQRPVFVLSEKFVQTHSLHYTKQHTSGQIPIVCLNFTILANETPFTRDTVEMCIKDVLQAMNRCLSTKLTIQVDFGSIGRLVVREGRVKMRFFREFITSLDSSGEMEHAFRPDTTTRSELSIMSNPSTPRPGTCGTLVLPRIVEAATGDSALSLEASHPSSSESPDKPSAAKMMPVISEEDCDEIEEEDGQEEEEEEGEVPEDITLDKSENSDISYDAFSSSESRRLVPKPATLFVRSPRDPSTTTRTSTASQLLSTPLSHNKPQFSVRPSTCSHSSQAGQELCYLCHQRAVKNVPVHISEERKARERMEDSLLQEYQHQKDLLALAKVQATNNSNRQYNKRIAGFNVDVAEMKRTVKTSKSSEFHPSYVFQQRALTPAKHLKQTEYCSQLDDQVTLQKNQQQETLSCEEKAERDEQLKLTNELAVYQEEYMREKANRMADYQRALAEQVAIKHECVWSSKEEKEESSPMELTSSSSTASQSSSGRKLRPLSLPKPTIILPFSKTKTMTILKDGCMKMVRVKPTSLQPIDKDSSQQPVFGVHDVSSEMLKEQKERARSLFIEQLAMVDAKQRVSKQRALRSKLEEAEMLKRTRQGLIKDLRGERSERLNGRQELESSWRAMKGEKQLHLLDELHRTRAPSILLHQQCDKYLRCKQCKRRRDNGGKSNLLCESRYISGSRLMV